MYDGGCMTSKNRHTRRGERKKLEAQFPKAHGITLQPIMLIVETRDEMGRPVTARIVRDQETLLGRPSADMLLLWGPPEVPNARTQIRGVVPVSPNLVASPSGIDDRPTLEAGEQTR